MRHVALPALTRDLAATNGARLWILNAYPIVLAGFDEALLMAGSLSPDDATNLHAAGAQAFTHAARAVLLGIGLLRMATGIGIIASSATNIKSRSQGNDRAAAGR